MLEAIVFLIVTTVIATIFFRPWGDGQGCPSRAHTPAESGEKSRKQNVSIVSGGPWRRNSTRAPVSFVSDMSSGHFKSINASNNGSKSGQPATNKPARTGNAAMMTA
jgi:hypothetical protein